MRFTNISVNDQFDFKPFEPKEVMTHILYDLPGTKLFIRPKDKVFKKHSTQAIKTSLKTERLRPRDPNLLMRTIGPPKPPHNVISTLKDFGHHDTPKKLEKAKQMKEAKIEKISRKLMKAKKESDLFAENEELAERYFQMKQRQPYDMKKNFVRTRSQDDIKRTLNMHEQIYNQKQAKIAQKLDRRLSQVTERLNKKQDTVKYQTSVHQENLWKKILRAKIMSLLKSHLNLDFRKLEKHEKNISQAQYKKVKQLLVENLTEEELNADIDLLRKFFAEELDIFADFGPASAKEGIKAKYYAKMKLEQAKQVHKQKDQIDRKYRKFQKMERAIQGNMFNEIPRHTIPGTVSYSQLISAKNHLKDLKHSEHKWAQENLLDDLRKLQMDKYNKKMQRAEENLQIVSKKNRFNKLAYIEELQKQRIKQVQKQKEEEGKLEKYWNVINANMS